jgi:hypothetical protein
MRVIGYIMTSLKYLWDCLRIFSRRSKHRDFRKDGNQQ